MNMLLHVLTFVIFVLIGMEIREGLRSAKDALLPVLCALAGMIFPALIFIGLHPQSSAWAVTMPTDIALALGVLALLGRKIDASVRFFLLTLAVADDLFSLVVLAFFYRQDLTVSSFIYTLGAAALGAMLPKRQRLITLLAPIVSFAVIPLYVVMNLFSQLDLTQLGGRTSISLIIARVLGKVLGITLCAWILIRLTSLTLPDRLGMKEVIGVGFLAGMGLTVSLVIADIALSTESELAQVRVGLLVAALISGVLGYLWFRLLPVAR